MFAIYDDNTIELTRGDSCAIGLKLIDIEGNPYEPEEGDELFIRLKKKPRDNYELLFEKKGTLDPMEFQLEEEDTMNLDFGTYYYEIELVSDDNKHFTVIPPTKFKVGKELESHDS